MFSFSRWFQLEDGSPEDLALIGPAGQQRWGDLAGDLTANVPNFVPFAGQRVGLLLRPTLGSLHQLFALAEAGAHVFLLSADTSDQHVETWARDLNWAAVFGWHDAVVRWSTESSGSRCDKVTILTSGTTGTPKAVEHSWQSLRRPVRPTPPGQRWLLTYRPHLYAGLQVILQCLLNRGALVLPESQSQAEEVAQLARAWKVGFGSATPSYWRWLLATADPQTLQAIPFQQITLGGEAVDQAILDALQATFPATRLVHIYATTELGRCFSVTDGRAGFPSQFLEATSADGVEMKVEAGELVVRSANAMTGYDRSEQVSPQRDWFRTGDLVRVAGDRVHFVGRTSDMINVGGNKVFPVEVEDVVRKVPGVADVRVYGETSSIVGQLVKCDLVVAAGYEAADVERAVRETTKQALSSFQWPRLITIVKEIPRTAAGKTQR